MHEVKIIYLTGKTGKKYRFYTFRSPEGFKPSGGVFAITRRRKRKSAWEHEVIHLDEIHDMSGLHVHISQAGPQYMEEENFIAARLENDPLKRRKSIEDLLGNYFPSRLRT
jgi:hypothetical protein